jgi:hypothetical protein
MVTARMMTDQPRRSMTEVQRPAPADPPFHDECRIVGIVIDDAALPPIVW